MGNGVTLPPTAASRVPGTLNWSSTGSMHPRAIMVEAHRQGVRYAAAHDIAVPDFGVSAFSYNAGTQTFDFTLASTTHDALELTTMFTSSRPVEWNMNVPPDRRSVQFPDLPPAIAGLFSMANIVNGDSELGVIDTSATDYGSLAQLLSNGGGIQALDHFNACFHNLIP